jgi:hypothetical protein
MIISCLGEIINKSRRHTLKTIDQRKGETKIINILFNTCNIYTYSSARNSGKNIE